MTERERGYYWTSLFGEPPEVARWDAREGVWWITGSPAGFLPEHVAVLSGRLVPPAPWPPPDAAPVACVPVPRLSVLSGMPRLGDWSLALDADAPGDADTSGVLHIGGAD